MIPIFFFAGKSLAALETESGSPIPWIILSALSILPIIFVQAFVIPNGSMENALLNGDRILVQRFPKPQPKLGDIIVFRYPVDRRQTFVKRVIGVPGDRLKLSDKIVYRNGIALSEPYATHLAPYPDSYRDNFPNTSNLSMGLFPAAQEMLQKNVVNGEVVVPVGKYFVLGDNRDNSLDSRYWGFVDITDYLGKPLVIYESEDRPTELTPTEQRHLRRIRWERFFKLI
ncbi:MAG TPA: signal peptidase I [Bryobacteraceae bacterium]|nr:signal peptidase I [Bryobacteraceae bacterium]